MRYSELMDSLQGITTNLLAKRLKDLQSEGILEKRENSGARKPVLYGLTQKGLALEPVLTAVGDWGSRYGRPPRASDRLDPRWLLFFLKRLYKRPRRRLLVELEINGRSFQFQIGEDRFECIEGSTLVPDLRLEGKAKPFLLLLSKQKGLAALERSKKLEVSGKPKDAQRFLEAFSLLA